MPSYKRIYIYLQKNCIISHIFLLKNCIFKNHEIGGIKILFQCLQDWKGLKTKREEITYLSYS